MSTQTTPSTKMERVRVKLPPGFDERKHLPALMKKVGDTYGPGFDLDSIDPDEGVAHLSRQAAATTVTVSTLKPDSFDVKLSRGTKPTDGDKIATRMADQYAEYGVVMTKFEPFLGRATLSKLDDDCLRARGAFAVAMGCKEWDIQIAKRTDGGFELELPKTYVPSKHDEKLDEVATMVIGRIGWRVKVDANTLKAQVIPGDPPMFPGAVPYPLKKLGKKDGWDYTRFGVKLPDSGVGTGDEAGLDWTQSAWLLLGGTPGSGKSVTLNALVVQQVSAGADLVIVDEKSKAVDFLWCKEYVRPGGWGCDSEAHAVAALAMVYEEGQRRAKILEEKGVVNWLDLPEGERFKPIFVVVDEVSALLVQDPVPKGVPKDHPIVVEINDLNFKRALLGRFINKIIAEQRFVGVRMVLSTQVTNAQTGLPPSLKNKIGHRILQGTNPSKPARTQSFNDEAAVPTVPEHVKSSGNGARGVGAADLEGMAPFIYKSYFAPTKDYKAALEALGVPNTSRPAPTPEEVVRYAPSLEDSDESAEDVQREFLGEERLPSGKPASSLDPKFGPGAVALGADGKPLKGAAAAAHGLSAGGAKPSRKQRELAKEEAQWASKAGDVTITHTAQCPSCGSPIHPTTGECRCS